MPLERYSSYIPPSNWVADSRVQVIIPSDAGKVPFDLLPADWPQIRKSTVFRRILHFFAKILRWQLTCYANPDVGDWVCSACRPQMGCFLVERHSIRNSLNFRFFFAGCGRAVKASRLEMGVNRNEQETVCWKSALSC